MIQLGLIDKRYQLTERPAEIEDWDKVADKKQWVRKMAVYAAMIDRMDQNIGRLIAALKANKQYDNTLIVFMSDNGGCAENVDGRNFNDKNVLLSFGQQDGMGEYLFPVDYDQLEDIKLRYGSTKIMYSYIESKTKYSFKRVLTRLLIPYRIPFLGSNLISNLDGRTSSIMHLVVIDLEDMRKNINWEYRFSGKLTKTKLGAIYYNVLSNLKKEKGQ
jgi:hypothetical protein